ncbi:hypothetical protein SAMIE_1015220 [Sphingobium amiense]|uniref:Uncharacterized protein n=1 Tax=Sphingobium amiense TaxID=135719 RepID=A0A494W1E7_9SPHN|nr:hypothetical protein [Sphingobium amiense]BBD98021.1 hypothetical protein SAMIE_1015220 [Sphingobium amiense]
MVIISISESRAASAPLGLPTNTEVRAQLKEWQAANRWPWVHVSNAMRIWGLSNIPGATRLEAFSNSSRVGLHEDALRSLRRFLLTFPNPPAYVELVVRLEEERAERVREKTEYLQRQAAQRDEERAHHERYWLSREPAANGRPARASVNASNPLFGLNKATVRALSGGTL